MRNRSAAIADCSFSKYQFLDCHADSLTSVICKSLAQGKYIDQEFMNFLETVG